MSESDPDVWRAYPPNKAHVYTTYKEGVARYWQEIDGLDVRPPVEPYEDGTLGAMRAENTDT